jgi:hypothetical protein
VLKAGVVKASLLCCLLAMLLACGDASSVDAQQKKAQGADQITNKPEINRHSSELILTLSIDPQSIALGNVVLQASLHNQSSAEVSFLPWNTPFDSSVNGNFLKVVDGSDAADAELSYVGRMVKRAAPISTDYLSLTDGELLKNNLDLTKSYNFCNDSKYIIEFVGWFYSDAFVPIKFESNAVEFETSQAFGAC